MRHVLSRYYIQKIMANAWTKLVGETFKKNRKTNKNYKFKDALVDAKKIYRKSVKSVGTAVVGKVTKSLRKTLRGGRKSGGAEDCTTLTDETAKKACETAKAKADAKTVVDAINADVDTATVNTDENKPAVPATEAPAVVATPTPVPQPVPAEKKGGRRRRGKKSSKKR